MNRLSRLIVLFSLLLATGVTASPADAVGVRKSYQLAMEKWTLNMRIATSQEERTQTWAKRPDATTFARQMWAEIGPALGEEWSIEPAAWFLRVTQGLISTNENGSTAPTFAKEADAIRKAIESYHMNSLKLTPICMALVVNQDPRSLAILEKIQASHPDKKIQGVAALAAAMQLKTIGDDGEIMKKRLTFLRKAIIQSSDIDLDGISVAKLAEDELYIIRFLTKGRVAPDLTGMDVANRPLTLSTHKGKVIVLLFWNSNVQDADRVVEITNGMNRKFRGRPLVIIGVSNDPLEKLRSMQADGTVTWTNFPDPENKLAAEYRVGSWPLVYVLDHERKIHYAGAPGSFVELTAEALIGEIKP
jgi:peroxiredoxin